MLVAPRAAYAENITARASTEVAGYQDSTATSVLTPTLRAGVESATAGWGVDGRYLADVVTAASPDIVATASPRWTEVRNAGSLNARYKPGNYGFAISGVTSYTPDYLAIGFGGGLTQDLDEKNLTLLEGYTYGHDTIGRTGTPFSVFSHTLEYHAFNAGVSRVVNPSLVIAVYGDVVLENGDQSKPYRYVPIFAADDVSRIKPGASIADISELRIQARPLEQLPLSRQRFATTGRLSWRGEHTALRVEERLYTDSWALKASTTDARYFIDIGKRVVVWPHARLHVQSGVSFWKLAYAGATDALPAFRTGDRELSPLTNVGAGGGVRVALGKAGSTEDLVWITSFDGAWTAFSQTIYVKERFSGLVATGLEVAF
jgi:hypothetical protein